MAKIIIIGGGLTGLSAAYHLEQCGFFDYALFEKEATVGGLCRSVYQDGFTFDYTGHLLHVKDDYFRSLIHNVVGQEQFNSVTRRSFIYSRGVYTKYPFQINLHGLPPEVIADCIEGFAERPRRGKEPNNFYDWVIRHFGNGIGQHFFFPFQQKILSYDIKKVTSTWMGRFVPSTSLRAMVRGAVQDAPDETIGYNAHFYYPKQGGIEYWVKKLAQQLRNPVRTSNAVKTIDMTRKEIIFADGSTQRYEQLISTMPLDSLLMNLKEKSSSSLKRAARHLVCNSVVNFNLGINRPNLSDKHWIYFPETHFPFYRVGFGHNFAHSMTPQGCSSLYGEFSYINQSPSYVQKVLELSLKKTKTLLGIHESEVITEKIITIPHAYVIYTHWREKNLPRLLATLAQEHVHSIGRYGAWKYSSMQEAVLDGKAIAEQLIGTSVDCLKGTTSYPQKEV